MRRVRALDAAPDLLGLFPRWPWHLEELAVQREHGPAWHAGEWFGPDLPEVKRQRYVRAVKGLAAAGLLVSHKHYARLSHVRLTPEGERLARELTSQTGRGEAGPSPATMSPDTTETTGAAERT